MKLRIAIGAFIWLLALTFGHIYLNIGFKKMKQNVQVSLGNERPELVVGFLPVT